MKREQVLAVLTALTKDLTPTDVHQDTATWPKKRKRRHIQDVLEAVVEKGDKPGQVHGVGGKYVSTKPKAAHSPEVHHAHLHTVKPAEHGPPKPPVMFTGKEGNIGKYQQKLVDKLENANKYGTAADIANVELPPSASKSVKEYQKQLLAHHGSTAQPKVMALTPKAPKIKAPKPVSEHPPTEKLAKETAAQVPEHPLPPKPTAPAVDTSFSVEQQALFKQKIAQLDAAYASATPVSAVSAIPVGSPAVSAYKSAMMSKLVTWQTTKPAMPLQVGETVSHLKVAGQHNVLEGEWKAFATRDHFDFSHGAANYRAALSDTEKSALHSYQSSGFHSINNSLRGKEYMVPQTKGKIDALDQALGAASFPHDTHVVRNFSAPQLVDKGHGLVGKIVEDPAFMSSSLHGSFAQGSSVELHLNVPKGTKALYLNDNSYSGTSKDMYEREVLFARNTRFKIKKVELASSYHGDKRLKIYADVLPPAHQPTVPTHHAPHLPKQ